MQSVEFENTYRYLESPCKTCENKIEGSELNQTPVGEKKYSSTAIVCKLTIDDDCELNAFEFTHNIKVKRSPISV